MPAADATGGCPGVALPPAPTGGGGGGGAFIPVFSPSPDFPSPTALDMAYSSSLRRLVSLIVYLKLISKWGFI